MGLTIKSYSAFLLISVAPVWHFGVLCNSAVYGHLESLSLYLIFQCNILQEPPENERKKNYKSSFRIILSKKSKLYQAYGLLQKGKIFHEINSIPILINKFNYYQYRIKIKSMQTSFIP